MFLHNRRLLLSHNDFLLVFSRVSASFVPGRILVGLMLLKLKEDG